MPNPIPLPVPPLPPILHARQFHVTPVPDVTPIRFKWACEDCGASDRSDTPQELGEDIAAHTLTCTG